MEKENDQGIYAGGVNMDIDKKSVIPKSWNFLCSEGKECNGMNANPILLQKICACG